MARQQRTNPTRNPLPAVTVQTGASLAQHPDRWIGPKEVAQLLGVSPRSVYSGSAEAAELREYAVTFGKHLRWRYSFVLDWMRRKEAASIEQMNARTQQQQARRAAANVIPLNRRKPAAAQQPLADWQQTVERKREKLRRVGLLPS